MFLNVFKDFNLKKIIKKRLATFRAVPSDDKIITIGVIFDETYFTHREEFVNALVANGIARANIETLSYKDRLKKNETLDCCHFTKKDMGNDGVISKAEVIAFLAKPFDLLISYYDVERPALVLATLNSKAKFRAGFSTVDARLNHFMINTVAEKYDEFITELFKYLRILNKL